MRTKTTNYQNFPRCTPTQMAPKPSARWSERTCRLPIVCLALILVNACGETRPPRPEPEAPPTAQEASPLPQAPTPEAAGALPAAATPGAAPAGAVELAASASAAQALPGSATAAAARELEVEVSELPPSATESQLLVGYERPAKGGRREAVELSTDHNSVEFPQSLTRARISYVRNPSDAGAGAARALELKFALPSQKTPFATCSGKSACGCKGIVPYAYISLSHDLPKGADLSNWQHLSFWARSKKPFDLHVMLSCFVEPRPQRTMPPFDGYLDEDLTEMNPCWYAPRAELPLREPIAILGDDRWHRYQVRIDDIPPSEPVTFSGGGQMVCSVKAVTHIVYVLKKAHPPATGEYPLDSGSVQFDDLQVVGP